MSLLKIEGLKKLYLLDELEVKALDGIDLEVAEGEFIVVVGRSGSGKTTLLRILAGLEAKTAGEIRFRGELADGEHSLPVGMVFQEPRLLPWLTVEKNLLFPFLAGAQQESARGKAAGLLQMLGLENFGKAMPAQLSGGMAQRAALGRALIADPEIVLLDEPLGSLDYFTRATLQQELARLHCEGGRTFIMVTHDVVEALLLATRVLVLQSGRITGAFRVPLAYPRRRGDMRLQALVSEILSAIDGDSCQKEENADEF